MLDLLPLNALFDELGIPPAGRRLVMQARENSPVRAVRAGPSNVPVDMVSPKMNRVLKCESRRVEYPRAVMLEHDPAVLEFYMQPCKLDLAFTDPVTRRRSRVQHTPDILLLRRDAIILEEWKTESKLRRLAAEQPQRYERQADGTWRSPLFESHLKQFGLVYRLRSDAEHPRRFIENVELLADYWHPDCEPLTAEREAQIRAAFAQSAVLTMHELVYGPPAFLADDIFRALVAGVVAADLYDERLADTRRVRLFRDEATLEFYRRSLAVERAQADFSRLTSIVAGSKVMFDGVEYDVLLEGTKDFVLRNAAGAVSEVPVEVLRNMCHEQTLQVSAPEEPADDANAARFLTSIRQLSDREMAAALTRRQLLEKAHLPDYPLNVSKRTLRRWRQRQAEAKAVGGNATAALAPMVRNRGNREAKIPDAVRKLAEAVIKEKYPNPTNRSLGACYPYIQVACADAGLIAPSLRTVKSFLGDMTQEELTEAREGSKAAAKYAEFYLHLEYETPVHGVRPFEVAHIDHTEVDAELISSISGQNLGRAWLSLAMDAKTRRVLGMYLTYDPPSYRSVMMTLRDVVRRFGRLPKKLVVDGGKEFESHSFAALHRLYDVDIIRRRGKPRHGSVGERLFGVSTKQLIHNLAGNTQVTKNVRQVVPSVNPKNLAEWTLLFLYYALDNWMWELYDTKPHPALGMSPRVAMERGFNETGFRLHRMVRLDRDFLISTCPAVDGRTRKIIAGRGFKYDNVWFDAPALRAAALAGKTVEVRYDPWSLGNAYAYVNGQWTLCVSKYYAALGGYTFVEQRAAFDELTRLHKGAALHELPVERIKEWVRNMEPSGAYQLFLERQAENRRLHIPMGMASITGFERALAAERVGRSMLAEPVLSAPPLLAPALAPEASAAPPGQTPTPLAPENPTEDCAFPLNEVTTYEQF